MRPIRARFVNQIEYAAAAMSELGRVIVALKPEFLNRIDWRESGELLYLIHLWGR